MSASFQGNVLHILQEKGEIYRAKTGEGFLRHARFGDIVENLLGSGFSLPLASNLRVHSFTIAIPTVFERLAESGDTLTPH